MKPIKRHILFCTGSDCKKRGNKRAYTCMKRALKNSKQSFTRCSQTKCLGACKHAPVMVVYPDGTWYTGLTSDHAIDGVVTDHLVNGKRHEKYVVHQMSAKV